MSNPVIYKSGTAKWFNSKGHLHRTDGPALEYPDGSKFWYKHGQFHRADGPAIEYANGEKRWYLNGYGYSEEEFEFIKAVHACKNYKIML